MGRFYLNEIFYKKSLLFYKLADLSITIPQRRRILNYVIILCGGSFKIENSIYLYTLSLYKFMFQYSTWLLFDILIHWNTNTQIFQYIYYFYIT